MPRVVRFSELGEADVLQLVEEPTPAVGPGEVRIDVKALGLNRAEVLFRQGMYLTQPSLPSRLGYECAGVVSAVGDGVDGFSVGDRVGTVPLVDMSTQGVWAEQVVVPAAAVVRSPDSLTDAQAAAIWIAYGTAWGGLVEAGGLSAGDMAVIPAASSSTGIAALQIARHLGATSVAVTRTDAKKDVLLEHGADHVIVTDDEDLVGRLGQITNGRGFQVAFDPVTGKVFQNLVEGAATGARIVVYGALAAGRTRLPEGPVIGKLLTIRGYTVFETLTNPEQWARADASLRDGFDAGSLQPTIARTFAFDDIVDAQRYMESNQQIGKIVVEL